MANNFRDKSPTRNCNETYTNYRNFKPHLAKDFNNRCGYTDSPDFWFGGKGNFHIDHFIPWKNYPNQPDLKTSYANLVYACSYVNILKSNDEGDYLDPCNVDFNLHFSRSVDGSIIPLQTSKEALYMFTKLKLYMKRYQIIWMLEKIYRQMDHLATAIKNVTNDEQRNKLLVIQGGLGTSMIEYLKYLRGQQ